MHTAFSVVYLLALALKFIYLPLVAIALFSFIVWKLIRPRQQP
jgi:hypothetical protein